MIDIREKICDLIIAGRSDAAIAAKLVCVAESNVAYCRRQLAIHGLKWGGGLFLRGGNNALSESKRKKVVSLIRQGLSIRQIASEIPCSKVTAGRYLMFYKHEGPKCEHATSIYLCAKCGTMRRRLDDGLLIMERGPRR